MLERVHPTLDSGGGTPSVDNNNLSSPQFKEAEKAVENAKTAREHIDKINIGAAVSEKDKHDIDSAIKSYQDAKKEAEKLLEKLPNSKEKQKLVDELNNLPSEPKSPEVNDKNNNEIPDEKEGTGSTGTDGTGTGSTGTDGTGTGGTGTDGNGTGGNGTGGNGAGGNGGEQPGTGGNNGEQTGGDSNNTDKDVEKAKNALKAAQNAEKKMNDLGYGRAATQGEHNAIKEAAKDYEKKKEEVEELINTLPQSGDKTRLLNALALLDEVRVPPKVNDGINNKENDTPDTVDDALDALKEASTAKSDLVEMKNGNPAPYTTEKAEEINEKVRAFNAALEKAQKTFKAAEKDKLAEDGLETKLKNLGNREDYVQATSGDSGGAEDSNTDGTSNSDALQNAQGKINAAKKAKEAFDTALNQANNDGMISGTEKTQLDGLKQAFDDAKTAANTAVNAVPTERQNELTDKDVLTQNVTVPEVNDKNNNNVLDTTEASNALTEAGTAKKNMEATLATFGKGISPYEKETGDGFINTFNEKKREAKKLLDLVDPADPKYQDLLEKYNALGSQDKLVVNDLNGNDKPDENDYQDALDKIANARKAKSLYDQYIREVGGAVNPEEYKQIKEQADIYKNALDDAKIWKTSFANSSSNYESELGKQLDTFVRDSLDVPNMNDSNNNDVPDSDEVNEVVSKLESTLGRNSGGGSLSATTYYNTGNTRDNGRMFNAIEGRQMDSVINNWREAKFDGRPRRIVINAKENSQLSVADHFGYNEGRINNNLPIEYHATSGNNNLLVGGNAAGNHGTGASIHNVEFGSGNDAMLVGIGNRDLKIGVYKTGEHIGKMIAKLGSEGFDGSDIENVDFVPNYFADGYEGYLNKFQSIQFGAGEDSLVVKQDAHKVNIDLGADDDYLFIGGAFYDGMINAGDGNDRLEFDRIGGDYGDTTLATGEGKDVVSVNKILNTNIVVALGNEDDTFILKGEGIRGDSIKDRGIQGGDGFDTFMVYVSQYDAQRNHGITSKMFQGFEKIVFANPGFLQLQGKDLLEDNNISLTEGKKVFRIESEDWSDYTWLNLGTETYGVSYAHGNANYPKFDDEGGSWRKNGTHTEMVGDEERVYDVYTFTSSTTGQEVDLWVYGMFHVV